MKNKSQTQTSTSKNESAWKHRAIAAEAECNRLKNTVNILLEPKRPKTESLEQLAPASEPKMAVHYGLIRGIPLPKETITLIALKQIYSVSEQIIRNVAFKINPEFINEAQEITQALLIVEKLLHDAGIHTDLDHVNPSDPELRYTFLQVADDVLQSNTPMPASLEQRELLAAVNKQFRPWVKQGKNLAKAA